MRAVEAAGEQWTPMRAGVYDVLARSGKPSSAYDIADELSRARGKRVAPNSVYRILDLLVRSNVAQRIESANAFMANKHPGCRHDCVFLICDVCGETAHVDDDTLGDNMRRLSVGAGFAPTRSVLEVRGLCQRCAAS